VHRHFERAREVAVQCQVATGQSLRVKPNNLIALLMGRLIRLRLNELELLGLAICHSAGRRWNVQ
jgi:hypothetical protein